LAKNCQKREISGASYWYIEQSDEPVVKELPSLEESEEKVLKVAKKIKLARQLESYVCPSGEDGCRECQPYEKLIDGKGVYVYTDSIRRDVYILPREEESTEGTVL
jgi:hypothetical protein